MDNNEAKALIEAFKSYRELLTPIQANLSAFSETYDSMRGDIEKLNTAFGGNLKQNFEDIYKTLTGQAQKASDLASRIDEFSRQTNKYVDEVSKLLGIFNKVEQRIVSVNQIESKAEEQIGRLDALLEEKNKSYNIRDLQRTLDSYNGNVQRVSEFINKDVGETLMQSQAKLDSIKGGVEEVIKNQRGENVSLEKLLESFASSVTLLNKITEKQDVNEAYIFEILDRWADSRKVKTKKDKA